LLAPVSIVKHITHFLIHTYHSPSQRPALLAPTEGLPGLTHDIRFSVSVAPVSALAFTCFHPPTSRSAWLAFLGPGSKPLSLPVALSTVGRPIRSHTSACFLSLLSLKGRASPYLTPPRRPFLPADSFFAGLIPQLATPLVLSTVLPVSLLTCPYPPQTH